MSFFKNFLKGNNNPNQNTNMFMTEDEIINSNKIIDIVKEEITNKSHVNISVKNLIEKCKNPEIKQLYPNDAAALQVTYEPFKVEKAHNIEKPSSEELEKCKILENRLKKYFPNYNIKCSTTTIYSGFEDAREVDNPSGDCEFDADLHLQFKK